MANITRSCRSLVPKHPRAKLFISLVVKAVILAIRLFCPSLVLSVRSSATNAGLLGIQKYSGRKRGANNERGGGGAKVE